MPVVMVLELIVVTVAITTAKIWVY